jgi:preprotein translocase subunit SecB
MADTTPTQQPQQPVFNIQRIYLKDASLEIPNAPQIFLENEAPNVEVQLDVSNSLVLDGIHEVTVTVTVTTRVKEQVAFLVEVKQAGIFEIRNVPNDQLEPILGIVSPNIVYPYLRANLSDLITRTGFPPIHLAEINFEAFFNQRKAALTQQADAPSSIVNTSGTPIQ